MNTLTTTIDKYIDLIVRSPTVGNINALAIKLA